MFELFAQGANDLHYKNSVDDVAIFVFRAHGRLPETTTKTILPFAGMHLHHMHQQILV